MKGSPVRVRASAWRSGAIFWFTAIAFGVLAALPRKRIADVVRRGFAGSVAYCALSGGLGVALGTLTRNQVGAVAVVAVVIGVVDPAFSALVPEAGRFGPSALPIALSGGAADPERPFQAMLPIGTAALAYFAYAATFVAAAATLAARRDVRA